MGVIANHCCIFTIDNQSITIIQQFPSSSPSINVCGARDGSLAVSLSSEGIDMLSVTDHSVTSSHLSLSSFHLGLPRSVECLGSTSKLLVLTADYSIHLFVPPSHSTEQSSETTSYLPQLENTMDRFALNESLFNLEEELGGLDHSLDISSLSLFYPCFVINDIFEHFKTNRLTLSSPESIHQILVVHHILVIIKFSSIQQIIHKIIHSSSLSDCHHTHAFLISAHLQSEVGFHSQSRD